MSRPAGVHHNHMFIVFASLLNEALKAGDATDKWRDINENQLTFD